MWTGQTSEFWETAADVLLYEDLASDSVFAAVGLCGLSCCEIVLFESLFFAKVLPEDEWFELNYFPTGLSPDFFLLYINIKLLRCQMAE